MLRHVRMTTSGWVALARSAVRVRERAAAVAVALALVVGPSAMLAYGRWIDHDVVTIQAVQWEYLPKTIHATAGVPVRLKIISEDVVHGFAIDGLPVKIVGVIPGKAEYVSFTPEKPGTYYYRCTTYCGLTHWKMNGQIIVTARR